MALVYLLLSEADPSQVQDTTLPASKTKKTTKPKQSKPTEPKDAKPSSTSKFSETTPDVKLPDVQQPVISPSLYIDIQIHISSDASADQIDQIFASMAKHLYKNSN